jgi:hypothetical protein
MLSVTLKDFMLSVIMLNAVLLSVVAPCIVNSFNFFLNFFAKFGQVPRRSSQRRSPFNGLRVRIQTRISRSVLLLLNYISLVTKLASLVEKCHIFGK